MLGVLVFLSLVEAIFCGGCTCPPAQWEGIEGYSITTKDGRLNGAEGNYSYDATNMRTAFTFAGAYDGHKYVVNVVENFKTNIKYTVMDGKCTTSQPEGKFLDLCCKDSQLVATTYFGAGNDKLKIRQYSMPMNFSDMAISGQGMLSITDSTCIPIGGTLIGTMNGYAVSVTFGFYGITPGIKDDRVFDKPAACKDIHDQE